MRQGAGYPHPPPEYTANPPPPQYMPNQVPLQPSVITKQPGIPEFENFSHHFLFKR